VAVLVALAAGLALAGCLGAEDGGTDAAPEGEASDRPAEMLGPVNVSQTWPGAEPVVDVGPEGTIYVEGVGSTEEADGTTRNVNRVFRSTDGGQAWTDVTPPATANESSNDGYVAVGPEGTVYAANVFELTFQVFRSTDQGDTWEPVDVPRIPALMHRHWIAPLGDGEVHITVEALDPGAATILAGQESLEGQVDNPANQGFYYTRSTDGGDTWTMPERIDPQINYAGQSDMVVSEDGEQLYVARYEEDEEQAIDYDYVNGTFYLLASEDGGDAWERREMFTLDGESGSTLTSLALDEAGTLYFVWAEETGNRSTTWIAHSEDGGETWTHTELDPSPGTQAMPFARALDVGTLGVLWYDADTTGMPGDVDADWHVEYAQVTDADTTRPKATAAPTARTDSPSVLPRRIMPVPKMGRTSILCRKFQT
jgi:hypothetical protein